MPDVEDAFTAVLISVRLPGSDTALAADASPSPAATAKVEKVLHTTVSTAGSSEEWSYFLTSWNNYIEVTKIVSCSC